jgi:hypothetical protein
VAIRQDSPQRAKIAKYGEMPSRHRKKKRNIRAQKKLDWTVERNNICFRVFMRFVWVNEATSAARPRPLFRRHLTAILHYFQSRLMAGYSIPHAFHMAPSRRHRGTRHANRGVPGRNRQEGNGRLRAAGAGTPPRRP